MSNNEYVLSFSSPPPESPLEVEDELVKLSLNNQNSTLTSKAESETFRNGNSSLYARIRAQLPDMQPLVHRIRERTDRIDSKKLKRISWIVLFILANVSITLLCLLLFSNSGKSTSAELQPLNVSTTTTTTTSVPSSTEMAQSTTLQSNISGISTFN